jgi:O-antigen/teichoic acid export membrane protein
MMRWGAFSSVLLVLGFVIGVQKGPVGVSAAYFITVAILMPFLFLYSARGTPLKARDFYAVLLPATTSAVLAWASIKTLLDDWNVLLTIGVGVPIAYAWALSVLWVTPDGRRTLRKFVTIAISAVQRWQRGLD